MARKGRSLGAPYDASRKTLFNVLGELLMAKPKLVLVKGSEYYRIEDLVAAARRLVNSARPEAVLIHRTPQFTWDHDGQGKVVVRQEGPRGARPVYAEVGSEETT